MNKVVFMVLLLGLTVWIDSCTHGKKSGNASQTGVPVNLVKVREQKVVFYNTYPATMVALKEVELRSQVGGNLTGIFFDDGAHVHKGQELYEIDRSRYEASYQQALATLDIAKSNVVRTQRDANRYVQLSKQDAIAQQRLDNALTDLQNARSEVVSAKAGLVKAKSDLDYSVISAPFNGTIGISRVRLGALITSDQTLLNIVSTDNSMAVDFVIDEKELPRFRRLVAMNPGKEDSTFRIVLPDNSLYPFSGKILVIDRAVDPQTGTIKIRLSFPNPNDILTPGMSCNVKVLNDHSGMQLVIPYNAVTEEMGEHFVYRADQLKAAQTKVTLGEQVGPDIVVLQGLKAGEEIVLDGIQRLHNGSRLLVGKQASLSGK